MKKLITIMASMATCLLFGDFASSGTSFEGYAGDTLDLSKDDQGGTSGYRYWSSAPSDNAIYVLTNYVDEVGSDATKTPTNVVSRPDMFASDSNTKYLAIDTDTRLYRSAESIQSEDFTPVTIPNNGIYLDTLVKFTPAEDETGLVLEGTDKIAIAYVENPETFKTNFVVRAGYLGSSLSQTNYVVAVPANFDKDAWHRLTVRSFASIDAANHVGFVIYLDQDPLEYSVDVDAGLEFAAATPVAKFYNSEIHALFPSAIQSGDFKNTISAVAFTGNGAVDDVTFTTETPNFIKEGEAVLATFTADTGVTAISVQVGEAEPIVVDMTDLSAILPAGTTEFTVTATINEANGYAFASMTCGGSTYNSNPATITGYAGGTIAITSTRNNFSLFDENGDPISGTFETLGAALAAPGVAKIQLDYDYTVADWESIPASGPVYTISGEVVLDLNGNTLDGGASDDDEMFYVSGAMTVIDSVGGGKIVYGGAAGMFYAEGDLAIGADTGDMGVFIDGVLFVAGNGGYLIRANVSVADNTESEALVWPVKPGSVCAAEPVNGYWVVAPESTPEPVVIPTYALTLPSVTGASAEVTSNDVVVADLTAIPSNTAVVVTWTAKEGYKITAGATENITMDSAKTAAEPTVAAIQYATLTIESVANCTIVVSNATAEVATGAKFDKADAVQLTVYRTPAEGYELDGCAASEQITMDQNQTVTAAVKSSGGSYPSYIPTEDAEAKAKYDAWATYADVTPAAAAELEDAFLLNCLPAEVEEAKAAFKFTSISYDTTQKKWVATTTTGYNERSYNGTVTVTGYSDVGCTVTNEAGPFFKATLD